jgi:membrane dipeptidase
VVKVNADFDRARNIQSGNFVLDAHSDVPLMDIYPRRMRGEKDIMIKIHLPRFSAGVVHGSIMTVQCDCFRLATEYEGALRRTLGIIDAVYAEEAESNGGFVIARSGSEMVAAHENGKFSILMGLEGCKAIEGSIEALRCLYKLGVRSIALTHNVTNQLGHGAGVKENYGLTKFGKNVVEEVDKLHIILDLAHLSERSFYDALDTATSVPIISHTGCSAICPFDSGKVPWRNVSDNQIEALADKGGVVGLAFLKPFVTTATRSTIDDVVKHFEHIIDLVGIDHVGIGADYIDYSRPEDQAYLGDLVPLGEELFVENLENVTKVPNFTAALSRRGYSEGEISKILGGNFLRVFKKVLG